tara:strand:- start:952 stop:1875 length:924 start_codon:yes stop_codon:yes gene_type:complete
MKKLKLFQFLNQRLATALCVPSPFFCAMSGWLAQSPTRKHSGGVEHTAIESFTAFDDDDELNNNSNNTVADMPQPLQGESKTGSDGDNSIQSRRGKPRLDDLLINDLDDLDLEDPDLADLATVQPVRPVSKEQAEPKGGATAVVKDDNSDNKSSSECGHRASPECKGADLSIESLNVSSDDGGEVKEASPTAATKTTLDYRARVTRFYKMYNPKKLAEVDQLMAKYKGKEAALLAALKRKYIDNDGKSTSPTGSTSSDIGEHKASSPAQQEQGSSSSSSSSEAQQKKSGFGRFFGGAGKRRSSKGKA